jgi:small GTP-binding protein
MSTPEQHLARTIDSLRALIDDPALPEDVRRALAPEFTEIEALIDKLEHGELHVAVFGRVSVGKSALLNALLGAAHFTVGVLHGTTTAREAARWSRIGDSGVHLIDTPGIDEIDGAERERLAHQVAGRADLVLFVVDGDLTATEGEALRLLAAERRPMLLVLNKADQYTADERAALLERLAEKSRGLVAPGAVLAASALPAPRRVIRIDASGQEQESIERPAPDVAALRERIYEVLAREGKTLAALNAGLFAGRISDQLGERLIAVRAGIAEKLIRNYALGKGVAVGLTPVPVADLAAAAALDVALVMHLGHVYGLPLTRAEAGELVLKIAAQVAALMGAIWGVNFLASTLKGISAGLSTALTAGAQGALAYFATYITGRAAEAYFQAGKSWGERGPKRVVEEILSGLDRDSILKDARTEILARLKGSR